MTRLREILDGWLGGRIEPPPVTKLVGITLLGCQDGTARLELTTGERHYNPMGIVHGGILCDLADAAMGVALASVLADGETFSTVELRINYFRPVRQSRLTAVGKAVHRGRMAGYAECEIHDEGGRLIAKASSTCLIQSVPAETQHDRAA